MKIYLVGGAVRDTLLGLPVKEKDWVVVAATPEEMIQLGFKPVGKDFPVFLHPVTHDEYALARTERKSGRGYKGFVFHTDPSVTLEEDLARRDLTINAIAMDEQGNFIDPFHGRRDLEHKILRHVSPAFIEDPVRILRLARLYARFHDQNFTIAPETMQLMQQMVNNGEVNYLVAERVFQEMDKALGENTPQYFFYALRECGALKILFPEIDNLFGVPAKPQYHPEVDTGIHCMMALEQAAKLTSDRSVRFAVLTHDLGKALTPQEAWPSHIGHEEKGLSLLNELCKRLRVPQDYKSLAKIVMLHHGDCHKILEMQPKTIVKKLEKLDAFRRPERFEKFLLACTADARGRRGFENRPYPQADFLRACYKAAKNIDIKPLLKKGLQGQVVANTIHETRIESVREHLRSMG